MDGVKSTFYQKGYNFHTSMPFFVSWMNVPRSCRESLRMIQRSPTAPMVFTNRQKYVNTFRKPVAKSATNMMLSTTRGVSAMTMKCPRDTFSVKVV